MKKGELTRLRIIEMAAPIFNQRGYSGCSMQDVMDATGLERGGLYRHFSSKEELAAAAFEHSVRRVQEVRLSAVDKTQGPLEQLRQYIRHYVEVPSPIPGGCPLLNTAVEADDGNPVLRALVRESLKEWKSRLAATVKEGIRRGEIRAEVQPRQVAASVIATLEGAQIMSRVEGTRTPLRDAQIYLEALLDSLAR